MRRKNRITHLRIGGNSMFCENCGNKLPDGAKFCGGCGAKTEPAQSAYTAAAEPAPARPVPLPAYAQQQTYAQQPPAYSGQPGSEPLRVGQYIGMLLLMCVPILNIILLFVWSFGGSVNLNKKNFARASLILGAIGLILSIVFGAALSSIIGELLGGMGGYY
jgi:hypothetical protein